MTFKTHYEPVAVTEKPEKDGWYTLVANQLIDVVCWYDSEQGWDLCGYSRYTTWLRPRPDTVLLMREEVEKIRNELPWVSVEIPPKTNGYYICRCSDPQEQGLIYYHVDTGWQNGFYDERVTHYIPISTPTSINSNE